METHDLETVRARWRRYHARLRPEFSDLPDIESAVLSTRLQDSFVRFLLIPSDPEGTHLHFDPDFWPKWESWIALATNGHNIDFGARTGAVPAGAVAYETRGNDSPPNWDRYLALHYSGALEFAAGRRVTDGTSPLSGQASHTTMATPTMPSSPFIGPLILVSVERVARAGLGRAFFSILRPKRPHGHLNPSDTR